MLAVASRSRVAESDNQTRQSLRVHTVLKLEQRIGGNEPLNFEASSQRLNIPPIELLEEYNP